MKLQRGWIRSALSVRIIAVARDALAQSNGFELQWRPDPNFKRKDGPTELQNRMTDQYTVVFVGDLLMQDPVGRTTDPKLTQVIRESDTAIGNMESVMVDDLTGDIGLV